MKCEVTERGPVVEGKRTFYKCAVPTDFKCTEGFGWWVCKHHMPYAMVAGWKPVKWVEENVE